MELAKRRRSIERVRRRGWVAIVILVAGVVALATTAFRPGTHEASPMSTHIKLPGPAFNITTGEGFVWVLIRSAQGCLQVGHCSVVRIDPKTNEVVGKPIRLADAWSFAVGGGSVWVTQFNGRLARIDPWTGRVRQVSARPIYFGSVAAYGDGFLWTGNDDERNKLGSVTKVNPHTNRVVGRPVRVYSPQSIAYGDGAVWDADHAGWLIKIDPRTLKVVARTRLGFGPHGVVTTPDAVYVADAHGGRLLEVDPATAKIRRIATLAVPAIYPVVGAGSLWSGSALIWGGPPQENDDRLIRIDPPTLRITETVHLGGNIPSVAYGFGSVWAALSTKNEVVRIEP